MQPTILMNAISTVGQRDCNQMVSWTIVKFDGSSEDCDAMVFHDCDEDCNGDGINDNCQTPEFDCDNNDRRLCQETLIVGYFNNLILLAPAVTESILRLILKFIPPPHDNFSIRWLRLTSESGPFVSSRRRSDDLNGVC